MKKRKSYFLNIKIKGFLSAYFLIFTIFINIDLSYAQILNDYPFNLSDTTLRKVNKIRYQFPDLAKKMLYDKYNVSIRNDTVKATSYLLKIAIIAGHTANYAESYDVSWKALLLSDKINDKKLQSSVYRRLGRFYSYLKRKEKSFEYLNKALNIDKKLIKKGKLENADLVLNYYLLTSNYRELEEPELAKKYLDSCYIYYSEEKSPIDKAYIYFEKAIVLFQKSKYVEAIDLLEKYHSWFLKNDPSYLVLYYKYWGDIYFQLSALSKSEGRYLMGLDISKKYNSHIDFIPLIYEKLTDIYLRKNDFVKAFYNIKEAKDLDTHFFDSRSSGNQSFIEIKDAFKLEKEIQEAQIQAHYLKQLEQKDEIKNLQLLILIGFLMSLILFGYLYFINLRTKHKSERKLIRKTKEMEINKTRELLDLKNKELASSALQLIEKDELLTTLKSKIRIPDLKTKVKEINNVLRTISVNNNNSWKEFKHRFVDVNKDFYNKIFQQYPQLSQTDHKVCALIKLNFSSKDMSRLLGISVESVHTSRHRLRKKMNLPRDVNLEEFINAL